MIGQNDMFGGAAHRRREGCRSAVQAAGCRRAQKLQREFDAVGFFLSGHPLDDYAAILQRLRVQSWVEFCRAIKSGASAGKVAVTVVSRAGSGAPRPATRWASSGLSDPTGHFEAVLFSEGLAQYRDVLEPGAAVLLQLGAELQGEDVRARVLHAEPLDDAAAKTQKGLRIFLRDTKPLDSIAKRLQMPEAARSGRRAARGEAGARRRRGDGDVSLVMMLDLETEVEMKLPGRFQVSPQIAGAIKAVVGRGGRADAVAAGLLSMMPDDARSSDAARCRKSAVRICQQRPVAVLQPHACFRYEIAWVLSLRGRECRGVVRLCR